MFDDGYWMMVNGLIVFDIDMVFCLMGFVFDLELLVIDMLYGCFVFL